ncbi:helicase-associated domain-containing protein [Paenibacillus sp. FSL H7-0350]|uniref:helicase-associated domain-containing protein n=1 Tax=Paenibacillus sp. FSL H7-0350 TaxID=2975345 RepID=UPI0031592D9E
MELEPADDISRLSADACEVLLRIAAEHAASPCTADSIERLRPEFLCRAEQMLALDELLQAGMLELRQKVWGERLYQIPQQQYPLILRSFWTGCPQVQVEGAVRVEHAACSELAGELFQGLLFIAREGLPLTSKGVIHKKQLSRLAGRLSIPEESLALLESSTGHQSYPLPVTLIIDLQNVLGLITRDSSGYVVDRPMLQRWLALTAQEMTDILYTLVISRYGAPLPEEQHFRHFLSATEFWPDKWFAVAPVLSWMRQNGLAGEQPVPGTAGTDSDSDSGLKRAASAWIRLLAAFGWCELGSSTEGEACFRWKAVKPQLTGRSLGTIPQHQEGAEEEDSDTETTSSSPRIFVNSPSIAESIPNTAASGTKPQDRVQTTVCRNLSQVDSDIETAGNNSELADLDSASEAQDTVFSPQSPVAAEAAQEPLRQAPASASPGFIVQPDFEVLVPPEVPYTVRWTLAGCAELMHHDDIWSFRLTRERLEAAADQGFVPGEVISWLNAHAAGGLPEQIELALRQWARAIGRTELAEVLLLSCAGEQEGEDIAAHPRLQDIVTRIGPLHFIVRPEAAGQLRKELAAAGLAPSVKAGNQNWPAAHPQVFELSGPMERYELPAAAGERGLLGTGPSPKLLPLDRGGLSILELPGEEAVPQMWFNQWRQYHVTTAQKVMEQALSWGIKVRISYGGKAADFIPERISGRPWKVRGILLLPGTETAEETELAAEDWQEIQLLHPLKDRNSSSAEAGGYVMIR